MRNGKAPASHSRVLHHSQTPEVGKPSTMSDNLQILHYAVTVYLSDGCHLSRRKVGWSKRQRFIETCFLHEKNQRCVSNNGLEYDRSRQRCLSPKLSRCSEGLEKNQRLRVNKHKADESHCFAAAGRGSRRVGDSATLRPGWVGWVIHSDVPLGM